MTIFVTGGAGFIGSNFVHLLKGNCYDDIVVLDKLTYAGDPDNLSPLSVIIKGVDIAYKRRLEDLFQQYRPKYIFNFAAETHVDNSIGDVSPFIDTNIIGTINLLDLSVK